MRSIELSAFSDVAPLNMGRFRNHAPLGAAVKKMVPPPRLERGTSESTIQRSNQLS